MHKSEETGELGLMIAYISTLQERVGALEELFASLVTSQHVREGGLEHEHHTVHRLVEDLGRDIALMEHKLQTVKKEMVKLINNFKEGARRQDLERLQRRADAWKGEEYISRDEFRRLLETQSF